jgi:hypothetical protein
MTSLLACASDWAFGHVADPPPSPEAPVSITLDRTTYRPGDLARLTVLNEAGMPIRYDICLRHLEVRIAGTWRRYFPDKRDMPPCSSAPESLDAGGAVVLHSFLPAGAPATTYRVRLLGFSAIDPGAEVPPAKLSPTFLVEH